MGSSSSKHLASTSNAFRLIVDEMDQGVSIIQFPTDEPADGILVYVNDRGNREVGVDVSDRVGRRMGDGFPEFATTSTAAAYMRVLQMGRPESIDMPYDADGIKGWFRISLLPLEGRCVAAIYRNVSDQTLNQLREMLATGPRAETEH